MRPTTTGAITAGATALGVAAILILNPTQAGTAVATTSVTGSTDPAASSATAGTTDGGAGSAAGSTGDDTSGSTSTGSSSSSDSSSSSTDGSASTSSTTSASSGSDGTYTGDTYESPYGAMQVQVTVSGGSITDVTWVQLPSDGHSQRINSNAAPTLVEEALQAQSADVASVSGATYTTEGFKESLQSALAQAGL